MSCRTTFHGKVVAISLIWTLQLRSTDDIEVPVETQQGLGKYLTVPIMCQTAVHGALFEDKPQSANDAWRKLHSARLPLIHQHEQEALARIRNNPIKMTMIRNL
ncbi:hypothetical protein C4D60_Mb07t07000 [Musa balbisiana]|uniref:Uncharacterized protein n=1 Tax=Musa balbisiana TaxID=52838 RepID=A0A4S8JEQ1_MUSBA|nr:hypothetical protein C4D60_Mb07t07000 [Musa balbisiana]